MNTPSLSLADAATVIGGTVIREGNFSNLGFAIHPGPGLLTWLEQRKYLAGILRNKGISAVIAPADLASLLPEEVGILTHENPREGFYNLHNQLARNTSFYGKHEKTVIHPEAIVEPGSYIAPQGVQIGARVLIESGARILPGTRIGADSIIRAGAVVGSQGLQFVQMDDRWVSVAHVGGVMIGEDVEIQANTNVCRAIFRGNTVIEDNSKIDALVHVAHNVRIGCSAMICAGVVIGGSTEIGDHVYMGPGATVVNCVRIGHRARITMGAVVVRSVADGSHVTGNWALPHKEFLRAYSRFISDVSLTSPHA